MSEGAAMPGREKVFDTGGRLGRYLEELLARMDRIAKVGRIAPRRPSG
jgi:hypothetical protein